MITVNGKKCEFTEANLLKWLEHKKLDPTKVAVELNGELLLQESFSSTYIKKNDILEIVTFVGGG